MASLPLTQLDPSALTWERWAGSVVQDLLYAYNAPNPGKEGLWRVWATELMLVAGISDLGLPDPRAFGDDWRGWAKAFILSAT